MLYFGGKQGARALGSLVSSFLLIATVLLPGILNGWNPLLATFGVALLIIIFGSYLTHGWNRTTTAAVVGMLVTVLCTGFLAYVAVHAAKLSGFATEESTYLNINTRGVIDFQALLLGTILIGLLGLLYDAAIGQAVSVEELASAAEHLHREEITKRALRIGREHIGALVNTLAIAYVGASLPLLLLFYGDGGSGVLQIVNREVFATEIVRIVVGSIGLVLAVPITTLIAARMLVKEKNRQE